MSAALQDARMREPTVMIAYAGPDPAGDTQDITVHVRPETNRIEVESALVRALRPTARHSGSLVPVYLANLPGDFMLAKQVVLKHYADRVHFARVGGAGFTPWMRQEFRRRVGVECDPAWVLGGFQAIAQLALSPNALFALRVPGADLWTICGQQIKRHRDRFLVNPSLPAVLAKVTPESNVFVLVLRCGLAAPDFVELVQQAAAGMRANGLLSASGPISHLFHYSKGPFESVLDCQGYLWSPEGIAAASDQISFVRYLTDRGHPLQRILEVVGNPIVSYRSQGEYREDSIFSLTAGCSSAEAEEVFRELSSVVRLPDGA